MPSLADTVTPPEARARFHAGLVRPTSNLCPGFTQANLIIVPQGLAFDLLLFAQRNPKPMPLLGVLEAGQTSSELLAGGDIRTDVPKYVVYRDETPVTEPTDVRGYWRDDLVTFIVGCSFTFEAAVMESRPSLAVGHAPGHMLITDTRDSDYLIP